MLARKDSRNRRRAARRSAVEARHLEAAFGGHGLLEPRGPARAGRGVRERGPRHAGLASRAPALDRAEPREPAPGGGRADPLRPELELRGGAQDPAADYGHSRDGRSDKKQITYGLLCDREGCPVAIEVFEGNASDPSTVGRQVDKIRRRFRLGRVALAGDRGMTAGARIREELRPAGLDWISALKSTDIRKLAKGPLTPDVPVPDAVAEIAGPDFPGERPMVCFNPRLRDERRRKRGELLQAAEDRLKEIARTVRRKGSRLRGKAEIARRVGEAVGRLKVSKHFEIRCEDDSLSWSRRQDRIDREAALDGLRVVRTSLDEESIGADEAVAAYERLGQVEQAFRQFKTGRLRIRPIFVYSEARVRARAFLCMLACHAEWHMRKRLAPILFDEDDPDAARAQRASPDETAVHSFHTLPADLSTVALNDISIGDSESFKLAAAPTPGQQKAFDLLGVNPRKMFPQAGR